MADPERLLAEEAEAWEAFHASIDATDPRRRAEPTVTPDGWSVTDTVAHVTWWLAECGRVLEAIADGTWDPVTQPVETRAYVDGVNAEHVAAWRGTTWSDADARLRAARDRARQAFALLDDPDADAWSWFEESGAQHYAKHAADLRAWSFGGGNGGGR